MQAPTDLQPARFSAPLLVPAWLVDDRTADQRDTVGSSVARGTTRNTPGNDDHKCTCMLEVRG